MAVWSPEGAKVDFPILPLRGCSAREHQDVGSRPGPQSQGQVFHPPMENNFCEQPLESERFGVCRSEADLQRFASSQV